MKSSGVILLFLLALAGNLFLAWVFWLAQESHGLGALAIQAGPLVLAAEFLAIYAGGVTSGKRVEAEKDFSGHALSPARQKRRIALLAALLILSLLVGQILRIEWLSYFFAASLLVKYFSHRAVRTHPFTVIAIAWFFASLTLFVITQSLSEVMLRWWGVVYFTMLATMILILFVKEFRRTLTQKGILR